MSAPTCEDCGATMVLTPRHDDDPVDMEFWICMNLVCAPAAEVDRECKDGCVWKNSPRHSDDPSNPCETEAEMIARREIEMPGYQEKLARWLS